MTSFTKQVEYNIYIFGGRFGRCTLTKKNGGPRVGLKHHLNKGRFGRCTLTRQTYLNTFAVCRNLYLKTDVLAEV
jgi:hypothetical protein